MEHARRPVPLPSRSPARSSAGEDNRSGDTGSNEADLRARLSEMRANEARGEDALSLYGGAAVERALDIRGPQEEAPERTFTAGMYDKHSDRIGDASYALGRYRWSLERLAEIYEANKERYEEVSARTNLPPEFIAALHFRESSGDFSTYLHQGDPLGRPAVNHPANIPLFHEWEPAAEHALNDPYRKRIQEDLGIQADTTDLAALAAYAEYYNGLGYHNKGRTSPYVYAGTDAYTGGKYVADGRYNSRAYDQQPGVVAMVQVMRGEEVTDGLPVHEHQLGDRHLEFGRQGRDVRSLQMLLLNHGFDPNGVDGSFGPGTRAAVEAFQEAAGLPVDGMVGEETADALKAWRSGNGPTIE